MNKKVFILMGLVTLVFSFSFIPHQISHANQRSYENTNCNPNEGKICNPLQGNSDLNTLITAIMKVVTEVGAILCVLAFIYSGFMFVTAAGDPKKIETGKNIFFYAVIGTAILLGARAIADGVRATISSLT